MHGKSSSPIGRVYGFSNGDHPGRHVQASPYANADYPGQKGGKGMSPGESKKGQANKGYGQNNGFFVPQVLGDKSSAQYRDTIAGKEEQIDFRAAGQPLSHALANGQKEWSKNGPGQEVGKKYGGQ